MTSSKTDLYLAIDQGGHASRALVFDSKGQVVAESRRVIDTFFPHKDWTEHDPEALIQSVFSSVSNVLEQLGERKKHIIAGGLATQRSNIVCWDKNTGEALSPIISCQDRRHHDWLKQFSGHKESIHKITGLFLSAHYGASKLRWCMDFNKEVRKAFDEGRLAWGPMASFLSFRLLDENPLLTDPSNASRTLLWNINQMDWSNELLTLFDLPHSPLPHCVATRHAFGTLSINDVRIPIKIITGDQSAALFAFGKPKPNIAYITVGTGAFVHQVSTRARSRLSHLLTNILYKDEKRTLFSQEGTVNGAGSALDWITRKLCLSDAIDKIPHWLAKESHPPLFMNGISGLGTPYLKPDFTPCFVGTGDDWEKVVAVIESIVFLLEINLEGLQSCLSPPKQILIGGGLARFDGLCQRLADLSGIPVIRHGFHETTALGLAYLVSDLSLTLFDNNRVCNFNPQGNTRLRSRYLLWKKTMLNRLDSEIHKGPGLSQISVKSR